MATNRETIAVSLLLTLITGFFLISEGVKDLGYLTVALTNSLLVIFNMFDDSLRPYSLKKLVCFYLYIFFILANGVQYGHNSNVLTFTFPFSGSDYFWFQIILFFIILFYLFFYRFGAEPSGEKHSKRFNILKKGSLPRVSFPFHLTQSKKLLVIAGIATLIVLQYFHFNLIQLLTRGLADELMSQQGVQAAGNAGDSQTSGLIFSNFIRPIPWGCYLISVLSHQSEKTKRILFCMALLTVFPTGLARNAAAMYWIPVFILLFRKRLVGNRFMYVMFVGIFVLFPMLDIFRYFDGTFNFKFRLDYLDTMNFDASQIFMAVVKSDTTTWGYQLLGPLFFFVPRSLWPTKPVGSGHYLVDQLQGFFPNVSMPFFGEGYINFGFAGLLVFTALLGIVTARADKWYFTNSLSVKSGYYLIALGAIIFILRGDLMSSTAYTTGVMVSYWTISHITTKQAKPRIYE